jgi:hypothetical protein
MVTVSRVSFQCVMLLVAVVGAAMASNLCSDTRCVCTDGSAVCTEYPLDARRAADIQRIILGDCSPIVLAAARHEQSALVTCADVS